MGDATAQRIWNVALGQLQIRVTRPNYDTWLKDTVGLEIANSHFIVGAPNEFVKEWLCTRMRSLVSQTVAGILGRPVEVSFQIASRNGDGHGDGSELPLAAVSPTQAVISSPAPRPRLNPKYSFQNFVVGASNRLAAAAAMAAASAPGEEYNPLFVYGAPGLGKTHLL
ncbi:MAG: chromosomal replication initiator protein DnaA, partial [Chloroflexi bacterium]|nr:chromosomal replication initiator protein DnaA [Chloroflexota bacterium]